ncbi:DUF1566 domain-containing protein [Paraburkholderia sp. C35]|uniref:DUF1566 domain-containing protein n=1 Tax=Paraburkholderia sp. C35 TaxID=2126993 RepID=UPI000D695AA2|nr:DUF1566 domain-containing protein [Paraburkholderia sp. C35]
MSQINEALQFSIPELNEGEVYAGILLGKNGAAHQHVILLPGDIEDGKWSNAKEWAQSIDGELPTRREQSLLFANCGEEFKRDWYWSGQEHESDSAYAWYQYFGYGDQSYYRKASYHCRARAVRRLPIQ